MLSIETDDMVSQIVFLEDGLRISHRGIFQTDEAPARLFLFGGDALKLLTLHLIVVCDDVFGYLESLGSVVATVEELVFSCLQSLRHGGHVEGWIDQYAPVGAHLLSIHAAHARADNKVWLLLCAKILEVRQSLNGVDRYIGGNNLIFGQFASEYLDRSAGMRRTKSVKVYYLYLSVC